MVEPDADRSTSAVDEETLSSIVASFAAADRRLVLSDFDGTLATIVSEPDAATILPASQRALATLADVPHTDVAVVSGRALDDVAERVGLEGLWYAGNHGLEISLEEDSFVHPEASAASRDIDRACAEVERRLADVEGTIVEPKGLTATIHYRNATDEAVARVESAVEDALATFGETIRRHEGKQVIELRPAVEWNKGRAVEWILDTVYDDPEAVYPVYLGDDVSDESAFEVLEGRGTGIRVSTATTTTAADVTIIDPNAVVDLLERLIAAGRD